MSDLRLLGLLAIPGLYLIIGIALLFLQRIALYPARFIPAPYGETYLEFGDHAPPEVLITSDGARIRCAIQVQPRGAKKRNTTVIILHGNAYADMEKEALQFYRWGCNVVVPTYRGYGRSEGKPTQAGLIQDGQATVDLVRSDPRFANTKLIIFGWSLGGAVALHTAAKYGDDVKAVITLNAWSSLPDLLWTNMSFTRPFLPFTLDRWKNRKIIKKLGPSTHLFMMNCVDDFVVPPRESLLVNKKAADARPRSSLHIANHAAFIDGEHPMGTSFAFWGVVEKFLNEVVPYSS